MSTPPTGDGGRRVLERRRFPVDDSRLVANASAVGWMVTSVLRVQGRIFCRLFSCPELRVRSVRRRR